MARVLRHSGFLCEWKFKVCQCTDSCKFGRNMTDRYYLLSTEELLAQESGEELLAQAFRRIDISRRERALRTRDGKGKAACVGAGLLQQLAVKDALAANESGSLGDADGAWRGCAGGESLRAFSVSRILELLEEPIELVMEFGKKGKPYFRDYPVFFNLSHSGAYVLCAVSDREVGADIQKCVSVEEERLAGRFFSEEECDALRRCVTDEERRRLFFRLWVRKEAYGKLLGEGIMGTVDVNLLPGEFEGLLWREWEQPEGYRIAVCQRDNGSGKGRGL